jgi:hypothetical protein
MPMTEGYTCGLGIVISGNWLVQNTMFAGSAAIEAYLPSQKIAIAVATTFTPEAFDATGNYENGAEMLFRRIGAEMAPTTRPRCLHRDNGRRGIQGSVSAQRAPGDRSAAR